MSQIHVFGSEEHAFFVNSFLVETRSGLILIDTQFLISSASRLRTMIKQLKKPLFAIVITHPHPDHFNGAAEISKDWSGIPIYATQKTIDVIRETEEAKRTTWTPVYGEDYPQQVALPNVVASPDQPILIDGLQLDIDDLGAGESADITVIHLPQSDQLIASDLLYNHVHPWLAEGRTAAWLDQLDSVRKRYAAVRKVYAGHGEPGELKALEEQSLYLRTFREAVRDGVADLRNVTEAEKSKIKNETLLRYPNYPLQMLIEMNVDGVAKELANEQSIEKK